MISNETEILKAVFDAINRNDIPAAMKFFDPQIERIEPPGFPSAGTYRGHAEVAEHLMKGRATWAEGSCDPEKFVKSGDKVAALLHVQVTLKINSERVEGRFADVFTFRNGKIIEMRTFAERSEALAFLELN